MSGACAAGLSPDALLGVSRLAAREAARVAFEGRMREAAEADASLREQAERTLAQASASRHLD